MRKKVLIFLDLRNQLFPDWLKNYWPDVIQLRRFFSYFHRQEEPKGSAEQREEEDNSYQVGLILPVLS